jgi:uncharacterized Tic20 family protein
MADEDQAPEKPEAEESAPEDASAEQADGDDGAGGDIGVDAGDAPAAKGTEGPDIPQEVDAAAQAAVDAEPEWPPEEELTKDAKTMAMLAWLLGLFGSFVGPLIIYLLKKDESKFVAFHALQSLFFELAVMVLAVVLAVVTCFLGGLGGLLVGPLMLVVSVVWCIKANNGEWAELPVIADWARKFVIGENGG